MKKWRLEVLQPVPSFCREYYPLRKNCFNSIWLVEEEASGNIATYLQMNDVNGKNMYGIYRDVGFYSETQVEHYSHIVTFIYISVFFVGYGDSFYSKIPSACSSGRYFNTDLRYVRMKNDISVYI